jgi:hypothetical protein
MTIEKVGLKNGNSDVITKKLEELKWLSTTLHNLPFIKDSYETIVGMVEGKMGGLLNMHGY